MIVVINPSNAAGHSFKGLHAYCSHDQDRAQTSERVDWIDTRNIATDDPAQAWKVMVATASAQHELKRAAGVRAGRRSKDGPVLHAVLSFDKDEPSDRKTMELAANEFLSHLGVDPAKMRGKSKPKRRQFADEHQVIMYAHSDTDNHHLHLMINTVHPETGVKLPTNNNWNKAQDWADAFAKRHGTDMKTPARSENKADRKAGEYVKGPRRLSRNKFELQKAMQAATSNDNDRAKAFLGAQRKKDAALMLRRRNMTKLQGRAWDRLAEAHQLRKASLSRQQQSALNKAKAAIREEFRPFWRALGARQKAERKTFGALESSFFGRAGNVIKTVRLTAKDIRGDKSGIISRTFGILTNAGKRKAYFEKAQARARIALQRKQGDELRSIRKTLNRELAGKSEEFRARFSEQRKGLRQKQTQDYQKFKLLWSERNMDREAVFRKFANQEGQRKDLLQAHRQAKGKPGLDKRASAILERYLKDGFDKARRYPVREQDNKRERDDENER